MEDRIKALETKVESLETKVESLEKLIADIAKTADKAAAATKPKDSKVKLVSFVEKGYKYTAKGNIRRIMDGAGNVVPTDLTTLDTKQLKAFAADNPTSFTKTAVEA